jgi:Holliday junction resolvase RusA-like endonuclease
MASRAPRYRPVQVIELPVPPGTNNRLRPGYTAEGKVRLYLSGPVRKYQRGVAQLLLFLKPIPHPHRARVTIVWYRSTLEDGDLDNRLKVALDVLSGHGYRDDVQVEELHVTKALDSRRPRLAITLEDLDYDAS